MQSQSKLRSSVAQLPTTSAKIRALAEQGLERAEIARLLNIRYQHVRNVLVADQERQARSEHEGSPRDAAIVDEAPIRSIKVRLGQSG